MRDQWKHHLLRFLMLASAVGVVALGSVLAAEPAAGVHGHATKQPLPDVEEVVEELSDHAVNYHHPPLQVELPLFAFTLLLFGVFVLVMRPAVWNPLMKALNTREGRIVKAENEARQARLEVQQLTARAEQRMAEVQQQVAAMLAQARTDADAHRQQVVAQAAAEAQRIKDQALAEIASARFAVMQELEQTVEQQVAFATEHIAGRRL